MLIKEYRIPLPLSVDEYKIAQLYMIAKKSREESQGTESGVEIIQNEPYTEEESGNSGQYTYKIYHVGHHLPTWLKTLLPKSVLTVEERAWNSYPYTKTRYTCPFVDKFSIEIETKYFNDCGNQPNVFNLFNADLNRDIDLIDIVKDQSSQYGEAKPEDDVRVYISSKTKRGPLSENWIDEYWNNGKPSNSIMCAYKLCRVEFKYWGMQNKIEKFIHDSALRRTMLKAHQQAWVWQDEWVGLTMEDIRRLELETQEYLKKRMAGEENNSNKSCEENIENNCKKNTSTLSLSSQQVVNLNVIDKDNENGNLHQDPLIHSVTKPSSSQKKHSISQYSMTPSFLSVSSHEESLPERDMTNHRKSRSNSKMKINSPSENIDVMSAWRIQTLARDSDSSNDEFYDAEDIQDEEIVNSFISNENDDIFSSKFIQQVQFDLCNRKNEDQFQESPTSSSPFHYQETCAISTLIIILHGGSVLDVGSHIESTDSKAFDITTFKTTMDTIVEKHYSHLVGRLAIRYVDCPKICLESLLVMSSLSPYNVQNSPALAIREVCESVPHAFDAIPIAALPIFAVSSFDYRENVVNVINQCNKTYQDFLKSEEGKGFSGKVCLIGDSVGAILGFDALCACSNLNHANSQTLYDSQLSIVQNVPDSAKSLPSNPVLISINEALNQQTSSSDFVNKKISNSKSKTLPINPNVINKQQVYYKSLSHPGDFHSQPDSLNRLFINTEIERRRSSSSSTREIGKEAKLDFEVSDFFMFGSMVGIVMVTYRKLLNMDDKTFSQLRPACENIYNCFHLNDPSALRIEPLLSARFAYVPPINVPRYQKFPLGDGQPIHLLEYLQTYSHLFGGNANNNQNGNNFGQQQQSSATNAKSYFRRISETSISSNNFCSSVIENLNLPSVNFLMQRWWGSKRIDYAFYSPEGLSNFPPHSLPHLFHSSYWESSDVISFILRQINKVDFYSSNAISNANFSTKKIDFKPNQSLEKWQKKRTSVKIKNVSANHRANDVIVKEGLDQIITGRFMYGPLDFVTLTGERVDIHMLCPWTGEWRYLDTEITDKNGRVQYNIPKEKILSCGLYQFKMVVRGDHTFLDLFMAVIPPKTEAVVFSFDGSLTASVSVFGKDPKVRAGAIDVVRFWQELGYLIIYITGRPDIQQQRVVSWLYQHYFPHGLIYFVDGFSTDPGKHKAEYLKTLSQKMEVVIRAAYGSSKDISVYQSLDMMKPEQIYVVGKVWRKHSSQAIFLSDGYAVHLDELKRESSQSGLATNQVNSRVVLPKGSFTRLRSNKKLPASQALSASSKTAKRTASYPVTFLCTPTKVIDQKN